jgi:DNA-binding IclR family transcriptional regulator
MSQVVPGLRRGLKLLTEFSARDPVLGAPELTRRLGIPRTSVFRLLQTLESLGFLERADKDRSYRLGPSALQLGFGYLASLDIVRLGLPIIQSLRNATGLACHIVIRDERNIVFVAKAQSHLPGFQSVRVSVGTRLPAHASTHGHVLMGDLDLEALRALYPERVLQRFTPLTPPDVETLYERVRADRERGYSIGESSFNGGVSVVSAPVRNRKGKIVAVTTVTMRAATVDAALLEDGLVGKVVGAADALSRRLLYRRSCHGGPDA